MAELELQSTEDPGNVSLWVRLGLTHSRLGEVELAYEDLLRARNLDPRDAAVRAHLAFLQFLGGNRDAALAQLSHLAEQFPKAPVLFYYLGVVN